MALPKEDLLMILSVGFNPSEAEIEMQLALNQSNKHKNRIEIIVDYKLEAAKMLYDKIMENEK